MLEFYGEELLASYSFLSRRTTSWRLSASDDSLYSQLSSIFNSRTGAHLTWNIMLP